MNPTLKIQLPVQTPEAQAVYFGSGLLTQLPELLKKHAPAYKYALITDSTVEALYGKKLLNSLNENGLTTELFSFEAGETSKNEHTYLEISHALLERKYGRDTVLIALGGGVVGDLTGFIAATYLRGVPFVQLPTTVLAMVDSSIGGKVGIDTPQGKNLIGAFWHPRMIVADADLLKTLSEQQVQNGWFEAIKMFACMDRAAYESFKVKRTDALLQRAMELKIEVVTADERESGLRSILNAGHSVGHALELLSNYELPHGFAIALGMLVEVQLGQANWDDLYSVLKSNGLDLSELKKYSFEDVWTALQNDKKNRADEVNLVLLESIGAVKKTGDGYTHSISKEALQQAWAKTLNTIK